MTNFEKLKINLFSISQKVSNEMSPLFMSHFLLEISNYLQKKSGIFSFRKKLKILNLNLHDEIPKQLS